MLKKGGQSMVGTVENALSSGSAWTGVRQPSALSEVRTNRLAMTLTAIQLETGKNAVTGLASAMVSAYSQRQAALAQAEPVAEGEWWDRPGRPFHFVFQESAEHGEVLLTRLKLVGASVGEVWRED